MDDRSATFLDGRQLGYNEPDSLFLQAKNPVFQKTNKFQSLHPAFDRDIPIKMFQKNKYFIFNHRGSCKTLVEISFL